MSAWGFEAPLPGVSVETVSWWTYLVVVSVVVMLVAAAWTWRTWYMHRLRMVPQSVVDGLEHELERARADAVTWRQAWETERQASREEEAGDRAEIRAAVRTLQHLVADVQALAARGDVTGDGGRRRGQASDR